VVELFCGDQEKRDALIVRNPQPVRSADEVWVSVTQVATTGIFILLTGAFLDFCRPILLPILSALVIGMTLAPIVKRTRQSSVPGNTVSPRG